MSMLSNALSGALAAQAASTLVSQNVANVSTAGYTRQGVLLSSVRGNGVEVASLLRFSENFRTYALWDAASALGQRTSGQPYLDQLEQVMGDDTTSIDNGLDVFFAALNAASVEPTSSPLRQQIITAAEGLAERFNSLNEVLANQRVAINRQRSAVVAQINGLTEGVAALNSKIAAATATGDNASGLVDERDRKIDALSSLVGVQVVDLDDGSRSVSLPGGQPLVIKGTAATLTATPQADGSQRLDLFFAGSATQIPNENLSGQLGGLNDVEREQLVPMLEALAEMKTAVVDRVNAGLTAGFDLNGNPGLALFEIAAGDGSMSVRAGAVASELGFSSDPATPGGSGALLSLIDTRNQAVTIGGLGSVPLADVYTQLVGRLGMASQQNQVARTIAGTLRVQAEENWSAVSGVNRDEEAINLMQYMQMYEANMKVVSAAGQMFDTMLAAF